MVTMQTKKILVTGATGFIGSHLAEWLVQQGYSVRAFDRYNPNNHWGWLEYSPYKHEMEVILGDIRDYDSVYSAVKGCTAVFHLAALIGIPYSYLSPLAYIRTNVEGTYNILEAARHLDLEQVLVTSTSETYGTAQYVPIDEDHPLVAQSPYAASKIAADQLALSYWRAFGLPVKIVRPFNVYGPRQSARAVIPTVISQMLHGRTVIQLGNTSPRRDLTFVEDTVRAFVAIYQTPALFGQVTNVGSNSQISIAELVHLIAELFGRTVEIRTDPDRVRPATSEVERLVCDNSKIQKQTGWRPQVTLGQGLQRTIAWMEQHAGCFKSELYNI